MTWAAWIGCAVVLFLIVAVGSLLNVFGRLLAFAVKGLVAFFIIVYLVGTFLDGYVNGY